MWAAYWMKAINEPIRMAPEPTSRPPNQTIITEVRFHHRDEGRHEGHDAVDLEAGGSQVGVDAVEAGPLVLDPVEGAHDPDAGEVLAHHAVERVDLGLDGFE